MAVIIKHVTNWASWSAGVYRHHSWTTGQPASTSNQPFISTERTQHQNFNVAYLMVWIRWWPASAGPRHLRKSMSCFPTASCTLGNPTTRSRNLWKTQPRLIWFVGFLFFFHMENYFGGRPYHFASVEWVRRKVTR